MSATIIPFLMFQGKAEEAVRFYVSIFPDGEIEEVHHYAAGEAGAEGSFKTARFRIGGQSVTAFESPVRHEFDFTPSFSFFVTLDDESEQDRLIEALGEGGEMLMEPGDYGFSRKFAWLKDRFGVSWQLNLA